MQATYREVIKGLIQIIWADGEVDDRERILLGEILADMGLDHNDLVEVGKMMQEAPEPPNLEAFATQSVEEREDLMKMLLALGMSKGRLNAPELRYVNSVAHRLEISDERLETLKAEVRKFPSQKG